MEWNYGIMCVRKRRDTSCRVWGSWDAWVWPKLEMFIGCKKPLFGHPESVQMGISKKETGQPKNGMSLMTNSEKVFKKHKFFSGHHHFPRLSGHTPGPVPNAGSDPRCQCHTEKVRLDSRLSKTPRKLFPLSLPPFPAQKRCVLSFLNIWMCWKYVFLLLISLFHCC